METQLEIKIDEIRRSLSGGKFTLRDILLYKSYVKEVQLAVDITPSINDLKEIRNCIISELSNLQGITKETIDKANYSIEELKSIITDIEIEKKRVSVYFKPRSWKHGTRVVILIFVLIFVIVVLLVIQNK